MQLLTPVAVASPKFDEFLHLGDHHAPLGDSGDRDRAAAARFQESLLPQKAKRAEDRVGVDPEDRREVLRLGDPFPGLASPSAIARRISAATCSWR